MSFPARGLTAARDRRRTRREFDNVGGKPLEAALACAKPFARFAVCGMIAGYNGEDTGPSNLTEIIRKRLLPHGFLVSDHLERQPACVEPVAFLKLSPGENFGKMLVKLSS